MSPGNRWKNVSVWDRIMAKVEYGAMDGGGTRCWIWTGGANKHGYAAIYYQGKRRQAHQVTWELVNGPLPVGLEIDHLCKTPRCLNPLHLEAVTRRENILRSNNFAAHKARQTHCKRGHEFTPQNTRISKRGERNCRACHAAYQYAWKHGLDFEAVVASRQDPSDIGDHMRALVGS